MRCSTSSAPPPESSSVMTGAPGPPTSTTTTAVDVVKCNVCGRQMNFDSAIAGHIQGTPCLTCLPYEELAVAMDIAGEAFNKVRNRRRNHPLYHDALQKHNQAHANYSNLILKLEGTLWRPETEEYKEETKSINQADLKRRREESITEIPGSPPKRRCSTGSIRSQTPERPEPLCLKRQVTFHEPPDLSQEIHRPDEFFNRSNPAYFPGRHAAPEGSHFLDTSGYRKKPRDFYSEELLSDEEESEPDPYMTSNKNPESDDYGIEIERQIEDDIRVGESLPELAPQPLTSASQLSARQSKTPRRSLGLLDGASRLFSQASESSSRVSHQFSRASLSSRTYQEFTPTSLSSAETFRARTRSSNNGVAMQESEPTPEEDAAAISGAGDVDFDMNGDYPLDLVLRTL